MLGYSHSPYLPPNLPSCGVATTHSTVLQQIPTTTYDATSEAPTRYQITTSVVSEVDPGRLSVTVELDCAVCGMCYGGE